MHTIIDHHRWTQCTVSQAVHGFERYPAIYGGFMETDSESRLRVPLELGCAQRLASFRAAQINNMPPRSLLSKIVIERKHAMHLSAR